MFDFSIYKNGYKKELKNFGKEHTDIYKIFICEDSYNKLNFMIIVDDSCNDNVLDYNEFGFELIDKYISLYDFMVLDIENIEFINYNYNNISLVYERR